MGQRPGKRLGAAQGRYYRAGPRPPRLAGCRPRAHRARIRRCPILTRFSKESITSPGTGGSGPAHAAGGIGTRTNRCAML